MVVEIPLSNEPNQSFTVSIPLATKNIVLSFFAYFNTISNYWELNITDATTNTPLITGLAMVRALAPAGNLLHAFAYLDIGEAYVIPINDDAPENPIVGSWGTDFVLAWG